MDAAALIARMAEQRTRWVDLPGGRRVQIRRPLETDFGRFVGGVTVEHVCEYACGWAGFTEATLLGDAVGASDAVEFTAELWAAYVRDHGDEARTVISAIVAAVSEHLEAKGSAAKN